MVSDSRLGRIACCAPLPPAATGIADYAAEQITALAGIVDEIRAYHPGSAPAAPMTGVVTAPLNRLQREGPFDAVLIHLGNHPGFHRELLELALARPSVVLLHEVDLRHLMVGSTVGFGNPAGLLELLHRAYGAPGEDAGRRWLEQGAAAGVRDRPLFEPVVDSSRGVVVHTAWARDRVLASRPRAAVRVVPHPVPELPPAAILGPAAADARTQIGLRPDMPLIGVFGFVTAAKRLPQVLRAFALVRRHRPAAGLVVVGDRSPDPAADELLAGPLGEGVVATGRLPLEQLLGMMAAVDVAVSLRHPPGGEASGTALRLLDLGRPLITSAAGWCAEIPEGAAVHISPDHSEVVSLAAAVLSLIDDPELGRSVGQAGQTWVRDRHDREHSARSMVAAIAELARLDPPHPHPSPSAPPPRRPDAALVGAVGRALAELGVEDDTADEVESVTQRLKELGVE